MPQAMFLSLNIWITWAVPLAQLCEHKNFCIPHLIHANQIIHMFL